MNAAVKRSYIDIIRNHLDACEEMIFLVGPRQVGKTTIALEILKEYGVGRSLNWDVEEDRKMLVRATSMTPALTHIT